jgi:hypothetical protein
MQSTVFAVRSGMNGPRRGRIRGQDPTNGSYELLSNP